MKKSKPKAKIQGEGDYEAAKRFNVAERAFVDSGKAAQEAGHAAPSTKQEAAELADAEAKGKSHAKGQDSLVSDKRKTNE